MVRQSPNLMNIMTVNNTNRVKETRRKKPMNEMISFVSEVPGPCSKPHHQDKGNNDLDSSSNQAYPWKWTQVSKTIFISVQSKLKLLT